MASEITRRNLLHRALLVGGGLLVGFEQVRGQQSLQNAASSQVEEPFRRGRKIGTVNFTEEAPVPMGQAFGAELDRRLYADLSQLTPENALTKLDAFYIRTGASRLLPDANISSIKIAGLTGTPSVISIADLAKQARPMGTHLMECAGNARAVHFGMMSVADWAGVPILQILDDAKIQTPGTRVLVSGFDRYASTSASSIPGASWIFTIDDLRSTGAFLATAMNGEPLTMDHGAPARLVVPGWYGCACIKWVNEISFVSDDAPATSQMQEYAARTLQKGVPQLARDYEPATIDKSAMPIRIEKWVVDDKIRYRVVGIFWGGSQPVRALEIRFNPEEDYVLVDHLEDAATDIWSFWAHSWTPRQSGTYMIRLRVKEPRVRTRKLDAGYYMRTVEITDI